MATVMKSPCCKLTGDVGGFLGLLIGASTFTMFEFLDLICYNTGIRAARWKRTRATKQRNKRKSDKKGEGDIESGHVAKTAEKEQNGKKMK